MDLEKDRMVYVFGEGKIVERLEPLYNRWRASRRNSGTPRADSERRKETRDIKRGKALNCREIRVELERLYFYK